MFDMLRAMMGGDEGITNAMSSLTTLMNTLVEIRDELKLSNELLARIVAERYGERTGHLADIDSVMLAARSRINYYASDEPTLDAGYKHPFTQADRYEPTSGDMTVGDER